MAVTVALFGLKVLAAEAKHPLCLTAIFIRFSSGVFDRSRSYVARRKPKPAAEAVVEVRKITKTAIGSDFADCSVECHRTA